MASFEGARPGVLGEAIREWRFSKYIPLYLAGIAAGAGLGIGIATWPTSAVVDPAVTAPVAVAPAVLDAPVFATEPAPAVAGINAAAITVDLPLEFIRAMGGLPATVPAPASPPETAPVAPTVPVAPAAQAPSAPAVVPAAQPVVEPPAPVAPAAPAAKPNFYVPEVSSGAATDMELRLFNLLNEQRAAEGLAPYVLDAGLTKVARTRSQQLIDQNYFAHTDPYGYSMYVELLAHFGFTSYAWAGENLAMNNYAVSESPERATTSLMNSPTHRANIMATDFFRVGIGEITDARGRHYFTMIFLG
jgi:uncharacterized protein YkwD